MSSDFAICIENLSKCYQIYDKPRDRLLQIIARGRRQYYREFWALRDVSFELPKGETFGIVGRNGAGKSTLLQLICGTLNPTGGKVAINGRVAALLELGAGFNPEFSGRENVYLNASILGLTQKEIDDRYDEIVSFSGIKDFIEQPVKTYSSGMYVRLAFSVATSVEPDILVVDEALSVGDGEFARKSFDRIMELKKRGATILFCSHSMYHLEAFCDRAVWLEQGQMQMLDSAQRVTAAYQATLDTGTARAISGNLPELDQSRGRILRTYADADGNTGTALRVVSMESRLAVTVEFQVDPALPAPGVLLGLANSAGITISSVSSVDDGVETRTDPTGKGQVTIVFPAVPLRKGEYYISSILACEQALHVYDIAEHCLTIQVTQNDPGQGFVTLPHMWEVTDAK
ncbi:MAG: ABC transporter ATP-binding protein [Desulfuromonadaceae bacterium]|jgi:lipopolysaccharide transport system ATP-binding protein|nr:ABC transporter ATP-binding protein [Desulfuromonadaceae bacterium]